MPREAAAQFPDPTRTTWLDTVRPTAERAIAEVWQPKHRACLIWTAPRALDRKGRLANGIEKKEARLRAFDEARAHVLKALVAGDHDAAVSLVERSEFSHAMRLAFSPDEEAQRFAEFVVAGDNAWLEGDTAESVLWICSWRE